ncbi:MAG: hypothetical protein LBF83_04745, partial [Spirochaetaceae bacterium]|nr:hypothetical protein [Spirochaetaceae bacterium]
MKNGICFWGTCPSAPSREQRLEFAVSRVARRKLLLSCLRLATMIVCQNDSFCTVYGLVQAPKNTLFPPFKKNS